MEQKWIGRSSKLLAALILGISVVLSSFQSKAATKEPPRSRAGVSKSAKKVATKDSGASAVIRTDGAMVYATPDFDGELLTQLREGQQVKVSQGTVGSIAKFHKVRVGPILGYIAEIDVQVVGGIKKREHKRGLSKSSGKRGQSPKSKRDVEREKMAEQDRKREKLPLLFTRYVGLVGGLAGYEEVGTQKKKESIAVYGLKITGPDLLIQGPIIDLNLLLHYGAPKAYSELSLTKPSGFLILGDALLLVPFFQRDWFIGTFGIGPEFSYRSFKIVTANGFESFSGFGVGLSLAAGAAYRMGDYALRLEGKYLVDKRVDTIFQLSLQNRF